jgi:hypothetical protein
MAILAALFALYNFWILEKVRRNHGHEIESGTAPAPAPAHGIETFGEKIRREAREPALEPGSVV